MANKDVHLDWARLARDVKLQIARKRESPERVAASAGVNPATVRRLASGHSIMLANVFAICRALDLAFSPEQYAPHQAAQSSQVKQAALEYGGYLFEAYANHVGHYWAYRRSFSTPGYFVRSIYCIEWSDEGRCLTFFENQKYFDQKKEATDNSQSGCIYINQQEGILHLLTIDQGLVRLITLTKLRKNANRMEGAVLTQQALKFAYRPAISPIFLERIDRPGLSNDDKAQIGLVGRDDPHYDRARRFLREAEGTALFYVRDEE